MCVHCGCFSQVHKFPSTDQMIESVEKLCKKVRIGLISTAAPSASYSSILFSLLSSHDPILPPCCPPPLLLSSPPSLPQVHAQVVDIFDNPEVVMAKFVQSLLERVLQVSTNDTLPDPAH